MKKYQISNIKFLIGNSHAKHELGFTLIEVLIVLAIFVFVGSIGAITLVTTLRTSTKTNTINTTKENGDFAIVQMTNTIRYAKTVQCPPSPTPATSITVTNTSGVQSSFDCNNNSINANGTPLIDTTSVSVVANSCSISCLQAATGGVLVQIAFSLQHITTSTFEEQTTSPIPFSTSVLLRNVVR